jgi:cell division protein FtsL
MKYYGNLALQPERQSASEARQPGSARRSRRRTLRVGEKLLYLLTIGVLVAVSGVVIYRYAEIYQVNRNIQELRQQYEQTLTQMKELQREVERLKDPSRIAEEAAKQGFIRIDSRGIAIVPDAESADRVATAMRP